MLKENNFIQYVIQCSTCSTSFHPVFNLEGNLHFISDGFNGYPPTNWCPVCRKRKNTEKKMPKMENEDTLKFELIHGHSKLNLYVFEDYMPDHTSGLAVVIAKNYEQAKTLLKEYENADYCNEDIDAYDKCPELVKVFRYFSRLYKPQVVSVEHGGG